jgi:hypothetical protein
MLVDEVIVADVEVVALVVDVVAIVVDVAVILLVAKVEALVVDVVVVLLVVHGDVDVDVDRG